MEVLRILDDLIKRAFLKAKFPYYLKKSNLQTLAIIVNVVLAFSLSSCTGVDSQSKEKYKKNSKVTKKIYNNPVNFVSKWKIDSIAENNIVVNRTYDDSLVQIFELKKNGDFLDVEIQTAIIDRTFTEKKQTVGNWSFKDGKILVYELNSDKVAMDFNCTIDERFLVLSGNHNIKPSIKKKQTFYMSKYKVLLDERIYGPNANK